MKINTDFLSKKILQLGSSSISSFTDGTEAHHQFRDNKAENLKTGLFPCPPFPSISRSKTLVKFGVGTLFEQLHFPDRLACRNPIVNAQFLINVLEMEFGGVRGNVECPGNVLYRKAALYQEEYFALSSRECQQL